MNPTDGWANFADYLALNKDASQRQLQSTLDEQAPNAEIIRTNAQRQYANAGQLGFEGNDINQGHGGEQEKLMMDYGSFVEGLSDPSRLQAYFAKHGAGGNSALDAGLASVAGAGQIQEAQKGLHALQNYVTERGVDAQERYATGQQARAQADSNAAKAAQSERESNARLSRNANPQGWDPARNNGANQAVLDIADTNDFGDNYAGRYTYAGSTGADRQKYDQMIAKKDPTGSRFGGWARGSGANPYPSWIRKPGGGF